MDNIQPTIKFFDRQSARLNRLAEAYRDGEPQGYHEEREIGDVINNIAEDIEAEYEKSEDNDSIDAEVIKVLIQLNNIGASQNERGNYVFKSHLFPWFEKEIRKAKGLENQERLNTLKVRFDAIVAQLDIDDLKGFPDRASFTPQAEVERFLQQNYSFHRKFIDLLISFASEQKIEYSEEDLRSQQEKDLYLLLYNALASGHKSEDTVRVLTELREKYDEQGRDLSTFQLYEILKLILSDSRTSKSIWQVLEK